MAETVTERWSDLVAWLIETLGRKLTAYVAGVGDIRALDRWLGGAAPDGDVEARLRLTYEVARILTEHDSPQVVQGWLTGVNPELGDRVPVRLLREGNLDAIAPELMGAARAFLARP